MQPLYYFIYGIVFIAFIVPIIDIILQFIANLNTWFANYVQSKINKLNSEYQEKQPCIGFHMPSEEEYYYEADEE